MCTHTQLGLCQARSNVSTTWLQRQKSAQKKNNDNTSKVLMRTETVFRPGKKEGGKEEGQKRGGHSRIKR